MPMSFFDYARYVDRVQSRRSRSFYDPDDDNISWELKKKREKEERQRREYEEKERIRKEEEKQKEINSYPKFRILFIDGFRKEHVVGDLFDTFKEAYEEMKFKIEYDLFPRWYNKPFNSYITPPHKENILIQQVDYGWHTDIVYNRLKGDNDMARLGGNQYINDIDY